MSEALDHCCVCAGIAMGFQYPYCSDASHKRCEKHQGNDWERDV